MIRKIFGITVSLVFTSIAYFLLRILYISEYFSINTYVPPYVPVVVSILSGLIFYIFLSNPATKALLKQIKIVEEKLSKMKLKDLIVSVIGGVLGLIIANLIGLALNSYGLIGTSIVLVLNVIFVYLGFSVAQNKKDEVTLELFKKGEVVRSYGKPKILDTSVIIDGRILDILRTGFIEGKIIIPNFILEELRHIADSSDSLKRNRGRRGLDILNEIQKQSIVSVEIMDFNVKDFLEVDSKLLKMAQKIDGFIVTNDYNLNKVAEFQGVNVLNINELSNAIKPVVLPGEEMSLIVVKEGKEPGQGVGYLNDGTMIIVEGGAKYIGEEIGVVVTSALQTSAGRMIFAKVKNGR